MEKKNIQNKLDKVTKVENISNKLTKFLSSDKGSKMVRLIGYIPVNALLPMFNAPNMDSIKNDSKKINILLHAVAKSGKGNLLRYSKLIDYTGLGNKEKEYDAVRHKFVLNYQKNKPSPCLTKFEQKTLNKRAEWDVAKDKNGKPIIKTAYTNVGGKQCLTFLYDKESGIPIYKYKRKKSGVGLAYLMHQYELAKMKKYDEKIKPKEEFDKISDLFPETIVEKYKMLREAHLESVRRRLCDVHYPVPIHIRIANKNGDVMQVNNFAKVKLGRTCSDTLHCENKMNGGLKNKLINIWKDAKRKHPDSRITCMHLTSHNPNRQIVVTNNMLGIAA